MRIVVRAVDLLGSFTFLDMMGCCDVDVGNVVGDRVVVGGGVVVVDNVGLL